MEVVCMMYGNVKNISDLVLKEICGSCETKNPIKKSSYWKTENIDPKIVKTKNNRLIMQSRCSLCGIKKSRFVKEQGGKSLLSNLGI